MTEKTGLEILTDILDRLDLIEKKLDVLMHNSVKPSITSSSSPAIKPLLAQDESPTPDNKGFKNFSFQPMDASKTKHEEPLAQRNRPVSNYIVVTGKMVANAGGKIIPLIGVNVKIFNDQDVLVKETKTNRAGHWVSHLIPGNYVALFEGELDGKKLVPQNRNFIVPVSLPEGQKELEIV